MRTMRNVTYEVTSVPVASVSDELSGDRFRAPCGRKVMGQLQP